MRAAACAPALAIAMALGGFGCPSTTPFPDGGSGSDVPRVYDANGYGDAGLFAPCSTDQNCAFAPGVNCLHEIPGGLCSHRCEIDSECGTRGICIQHLCLLACTTGGNECVALGAACAPGDVTGLRACVASCFDPASAPPGVATCGAGLTCDLYAGICTAMPDTSGAENGSPCRDSGECRGGSCLTEEYSAGHSTGYVHGYCASWGVRPPDSAFAAGQPMPRSNCPPGSVVLPSLMDGPIYAAGTVGDAALCFRGCVTDRECREGYACTYLGTTRTSTGACLPIDCSAGTVTCPTGYTCDASETVYQHHPVCRLGP